MKPGTRQQYIISDINITPLTDIFLVLLVIMMVLAPSLSDTPENVTTPEITSGGTPSADSVKVAITNEDEILVEGEKYPEDDLLRALQAAKDSKQAKNVSISADAGIENRLMFKVLQAATDAEFEKAAIVGMQKNE